RIGHGENQYVSVGASRPARGASTIHRIRSPWIGRKSRRQKPLCCIIVYKNMGGPINRATMAMARAALLAAFDARLPEN
ncbi:MAG: hypothetical protein ACLP8B_09255, partial [Xanthobacteraceae bacterium]